MIIISLWMVGGGWRWVAVAGGLQQFSVSPSPFGFLTYLELVGKGHGRLLGLGLDNKEHGALDHVQGEHHYSYFLQSIKEYLIHSLSLTLLHTLRKEKTSSTTNNERCSSNIWLAAPTMQTANYTTHHISTYILSPPHQQSRSRAVCCSGVKNKRQLYFRKLSNLPFIDIDKVLIHHCHFIMKNPVP